MKAIPRRNEGWIPELEGIRGLLSILVVLGHIHPEPIFWFPGCMDVFFVISGFLITRIILRSRKPLLPFLKNYIPRRMLRIWPLYFFCLPLYFLFSALIAPATDLQWDGHPLAYEFSWDTTLLSTLFLQNTEAYLGLPRLAYPKLFDHAWSIAIEEQFYILWPLLLFAVGNSSAFFRIALCIAAIAGALIVRATFYLEFDTPVGMWLLLGRMDSFALGTALAFLERHAPPDRHPEAGTRKALFIGALVLSLIVLGPYLVRGYWDATIKIPTALAWSAFDPTLGFSLLAFATIGLTISNSGSRSLGILRSRALMHIGAISYSTYLLHPIIIASAFAIPGMDNFIAEGWPKAVLGLLLSLTLSHLSFKYIEQKALLLKRRFAY